MDEIKLTDLISTKVLQGIQDAFSNMVGMAALTTDEDGEPITKGSNFSHYCMGMTRRSAVGCERCCECDRNGAVMAGQSKKPYVYTCHSGLIDFAAPIFRLIRRRRQRLPTGICI